MLVFACMNKVQAQKYIELTLAAYNEKAVEFDRTRSYLPSDIISLASNAVDGDKILDVGCGNGRLVDCFKANVDYVGLDNSSKLIDIAKIRYPKNHFKIIDDIENLPYSNSYFDKLYCLAVFHHLPTTDKRLEVLKEFLRVLRAGGYLYLTVWDLTTRKGYDNIAEASRNDSVLEEGDLLLPLFSPDRETLRYVHQFTESELRSLATNAGYINIEITHTKRGVKDGQSNIQLVCAKP